MYKAQPFLSSVQNEESLITENNGVIFFCKNFNFPGVFSKQKVKVYAEDFPLLLIVSFFWLVKTILNNLQNSGRCLM
jgi:hypothetical protein